MKRVFHSAKSNMPQRGFTVIELLVVIAILGVLAALAAPSFTETIKRYRVNAIRDNMTSAIQLARSEAIRRRLPVVLLRTTGCSVTLATTSDWDCGWQMFVDVDNNGLLGSSETVVQEFTVPAGHHLTNDSTTAGPSVAVTRFGHPATVATVTSVLKRFVISPPEGTTGAATSTICFFPGGRVTAFKGTAACT